MGNPQANSKILEIIPYVGGKSSIAGAKDVMKLSSNESMYGPSPLAKSAYQDAGLHLELYPDTEHFDLRQAISDVHDIEPEKIICGAGSDELISFLCQTYAAGGDEIIYTEHGFGMYKISALAAGATPVCVGENNRVVDVDAILAGITPKTKLIFIANPGNPTGTFLGKTEMTRLADAIPTEVILVLDAAYAEFVTDGDYDAGADLAASRPNIVMLRTFSKAYGLGGMRVGWGVASEEILSCLNRVRGPFNLSSPALVTATAAVKDCGYLDEVVQKTIHSREKFIDDLRDLGLECDDSQTNFVLVRFEDERLAGQCYDYLLENGIIVRKVIGYGFSEALRITIATDDVCARVITKITAWQEGL